MGLVIVHERVLDTILAVVIPSFCPSCLLVHLSCTFQPAFGWIENETDLFFLWRREFLALVF